MKQRRTAALLDYASIADGSIAFRRFREKKIEERNRNILFIEERKSHIWLGSHAI